MVTMGKIQATLFNKIIRSIMDYMDYMDYRIAIMLFIASFIITTTSFTIINNFITRPVQIT